MQHKMVTNTLSQIACVKVKSNVRNTASVWLNPKSAGINVQFLLKHESRKATQFNNIAPFTSVARSVVFFNESILLLHVSLNCSATYSRDYTCVVKQVMLKFTEC